MSASYVVRDISYSARRGENGNIELVVEVEGIGFVKETIPDGQLAGTVGHREVPSTRTTTFDLHPTEAEGLWQELGRALGKYGF